MALKEGTHYGTPGYQGSEEHARRVAKVAAEMNNYCAELRRQNRIARQIAEKNRDEIRRTHVYDPELGYVHVSQIRPSSEGNDLSARTN